MLIKNYMPSNFAFHSPTPVSPRQGSIFESNAIARYVARIRRDTELYGASFFESAQASVGGYCFYFVAYPKHLFVWLITVE